jgi:hypothetical protein
MKLPVPVIVAIGLAGFAAFFVALWLGVLGIVATVGGWRGLAREYPDPAVALPQGRRVSGASLLFVRGVVSVGNYRGSVTLLTNDRGLYLRTGRLFGPFHPPIAIPWAAITGLQEGRTFGSPWVEVDIRNGESVRVIGRAATVVKEGYAAAR